MIENGLNFLNDWNGLNPSLRFTNSFNQFKSFKPFNTL